jgi:type IV pilus assembly protein PilV
MLSMQTLMKRQQTGFSLIEAMVSLVVVSVGMIGIAALYGQGLSAGRTALYRTQAVNLAADMADRIRVNRLGGANYGGPGANNNCDPPAAVNCAPPQMAAHDIWVWTALVQNQLPNGVGAVNVAGTSPPTYTINVGWQETGLGPVNYQMIIRVPNL